MNVPKYDGPAELKLEDGRVLVGRAVIVEYVADYDHAYITEKITFTVIQTKRVDKK